MKVYFHQKTLNDKVTFTGKGLHSGRIVKMDVCPAEANTGIVFYRVDNPGASGVLADISNVTNTELCTVIGSGMNSVGTIEHLMAAFAGLGVDNAIVRINGPEVPIMDGSAAPFVRAFNDVGIRTFDVRRKYYTVKRPFEVRVGDRYVRIEPANQLKITCNVNYANSFIGERKASVIFNKNSFEKIIQSRTFCMFREIQLLRNAGFALGGSLENAVVVSENSILNPEGLRFEDEPVYHKILDCIGDLALFGAPIIGHIKIGKAGHSLHCNFMFELLKKKNNYLTLVGGDSNKLDMIPDFNGGRCIPDRIPAFG